MQYLIAYCSRPEAAIDIISGMLVGTIVPDKRVKYRDPRLSHSVDAPFFNSDKCRLEVAGDVISGVALDDVSMDVSAIFCDSRLNSGQIIRLWPAQPAFMHYLIAICNQPEAASDVISGMFVRLIALDKRVKFHDPCLTVLEKFHPKSPAF